MPSRSASSSQALKYVPNTLRWLILIAAILIVLGSLNVYSTTYYMDIEGGSSPYIHFLRHLIFLGLSVFVGWFLSRLRVETIQKLNIPVYFLTILLLLAVMVFGQSVNGANRWLKLGPLSIQPSELAKLTGIIWTATFLSIQLDRHVKISLLGRFFQPLIRKLHHKKSPSFTSTFWYFLPILGPFVLAALVLLQPDMGTAGMILLFPVLLYVISGLPKMEILICIAAAAAGFFGLAAIEPYRWSRVAVMWDPFPYAQDSGYQTVQSLIAVGSGGILGQGIGQGMSKFLYLPEQFTDFAFAVFSQEYGFIGSCFVLCLYIAFLVCGFSLARRLRYLYSSLLVYGLTMMISVQGFMNIAMVIGMFPVTGVPLPFISYGGTSLMVNIAALGIIWGTVKQSLKKADMEDRRKHLLDMQ